MTDTQAPRGISRAFANFGDERLPPRFWNKVQPCPMSGCWLWTGGSARGYGVFPVPRSPSNPRKSRLDSGHVNGVAHRLSYEALIGSIPTGLVLDHLCRVRCCVNPLHLEPVTPQENQRRGLCGALTTHCPKGHPYDESNTRLRKTGARRCAACNRENVSRWKSELRGLGRAAFRAGTTASGAVAYAVAALGRDIAGSARQLVMIGWAAERSEVNS